MPKLASTRSSLSEITMGCCMASRSRFAIAFMLEVASTDDREGDESTMNSSPPSRATMSFGRMQSLILSATAEIS